MYVCTIKIISKTNDAEMSVMLNFTLIHRLICPRYEFLSFLNCIQDVRVNIIKSHASVIGIEFLVEVEEEELIVVCFLCCCCCSVFLFLFFLVLYDDDGMQCYYYNKFHGRINPQMMMR